MVVCHRDGEKSDGRLDHGKKRRDGPPGRETVPIEVSVANRYSLTVDIAVPAGVSITKTTRRLSSAPKALPDAFGTTRRSEP